MEVWGVSACCTTCRTSRLSNCSVVCGNVHSGYLFQLRVLKVISGSTTHDYKHRSLSGLPASRLQCGSNFHSLRRFVYTPTMNFVLCLMKPGGRLKRAGHLCSGTTKSLLPSDGFTNGVSLVG